MIGFSEKAENQWIKGSAIGVSLSIGSRYVAVVDWIPAFAGTMF